MREMVSFEVDKPLKEKMEKAILVSGLTRSEMCREGVREAVHRYLTPNNINEVEAKSFFNRILQAIKK